jgi:ATP-dependent DNA helicase DinG
MGDTPPEEIQVTVETFAEAEIALASSLPNYESRPQQQRLARAVEAVFAREENFRLVANEQTGAPFLDARHLIAQAGCGVGKSLGYLIPAILSGKRVAVSVTTKALQDQLSTKDLPFLQEHLGHPFTYAVLKGRSNYFCTAHAMAASMEDVPQLGQMLRHIDATPDFGGMREDFPFEVSVSAWSKVSSEGDECRDLNCKSRGDCYAERARAAAQDANVVVVNHALLFTDLAAYNNLIGPYELVIFDEAHEVEEIAASNLGSRFAEGTLVSLANDTRSWAANNAVEGDDTISDPAGELAGAAVGLFQALPVGRNGESLRLREQQIADCAKEFGEVYGALHALKGAFDKLRTDADVDDRARNRRSIIARSSSRRCPRSSCRRRWR